jgi:hypothetical protein
MIIHDIHYTSACIALSKYLGFKHEFNGDYEDPRWFWIPPSDPDGGLNDIPIRISIHGKLTNSQKQAIDDLITAAPQMLEALLRIRETGVFLGAIAQEMMDSAIAKTDGRKPYAFLETLHDDIKYSIAEIEGEKE